MELFNSRVLHVIKNAVLYSIENVEQLRCYILGYSNGLKVCNSKDLELDIFENEFTFWLRNYYLIESTQNWACIIRFFSTSSSDSLIQFEERFLEFISSFDV